MPKLLRTVGRLQLLNMAWRHRHQAASWGRQVSGSVRSALEGNLGDAARELKDKYELERALGSDAHRLVVDRSDGRVGLRGVAPDMSVIDDAAQILGEADPRLDVRVPRFARRSRSQQRVVEPRRSAELEERTGT